MLYCVNCLRARARAELVTSLPPCLPPATALRLIMPLPRGLSCPALAPTCVWSLITFVVNFVTTKATAATKVGAAAASGAGGNGVGEGATSMSLQKLKFAFNSRSAHTSPVLSFRFLYPFSRLTFYISLTFYKIKVRARKKEGERERAR